MGVEESINCPIPLPLGSFLLRFPRAGGSGFRVRHTLTLHCILLRTTFDSASVAYLLGMSVVEGIGCSMQDVGCRVSGVGSRLQGIRCRVRDAGCGV